MGYAKEFNFEKYSVPAILHTADWEDVSWGNDICPRWENKDLHIAVWVDCINPEDREYEDWKQYTIVGLTVRSDGTTVLDDDDLFATEDPLKLDIWIHLHASKLLLEAALDEVTEAEMSAPELHDSIAIALKKLEEMLRGLSE